MNLYANHRIHRRALECLAGITFILLVTGCASQVVKEDHLKQRTAFALGLDQSAFTVSDRVDDKLQTRYSVNTNDGRKYNCYVEGSFSFGTGSVVSDAICSQIGGGERMNSKSKPGSGPVCNDLLRAAGKC